MVKIHITGSHLDEVLRSLDAVPKDRYDNAMDNLADTMDERHKLKTCIEELETAYRTQTNQLSRLADSEAAMVERSIVRESELQTVTQERDELQQRYDACVVVRDEASSQVKTLMDKIDALDPGDHQKNKSLFNADEVQRMRNDSYEKGVNAGYERGKSEQMAEHAAELLNRKRHLTDMLQHSCVDLTLKEPDGGLRAAFRFEPYLWAEISVACRLLRDGDKLRGLFSSGTFVMVGYNTLTRKIMAVAPENVKDWTIVRRTAPEALAPEPENG
jgi:hypothetical protein